MAEFAFIFPGQGSQSVGMLDAWGDHPAVRGALAEASAALGQDVAEMIHSGPADMLGLTENTQVVMLTAGVACYRAWIAEGGRAPAAVAGHSLGEYSALVAAGTLTLADAVLLVRFRAQAMQAAVPVGAGAMVAVLGLEADAVRLACEQAAADADEPVAAANFNEPKQIVIAGTKAAVARACDVLKAAGAKRTIALPVSAPFHSVLMKPAADRLAERLQSVSMAAPSIAVVNNIDVAVETDVARIRDALYRQAYGPVRWVEVMQALHARGITQVVECGPGKVLSRMVSRIVPEMRAGALFDPASLTETRGLLS
jgi:[acyl-carrier-protein] S-malonyltransferase